jgi:hypothetical protein
VEEQGGGEDGESEYCGGAEGEGPTQALGEPLAGRVKQLIAELAGEMPGPATGLPRVSPAGAAVFRRDPGRQGANRLAAADGRADDTKRATPSAPAERGAGLRERRPCRSGGAAPTARSVANVSTGLTPPRK